MPWLWIAGAAAVGLLLLTSEPATIWEVTFDRGGLHVGSVYARNQAEAQNYAAKLKQRGFNVLGVAAVSGTGLSYRLGEDRERMAKL